MKEIDEQLTQAKELWDDGKQAQAIQILEELDEKTPTTQVAELLNHFTLLINNILKHYNWSQISRPIFCIIREFLRII